ncbi:uncharacterized protein EKO05_0001303 [Ascochyta rabiei]|uniref:Uncharacterized protein n=1 Tax=Didymella rabiei TaxID=5454 RepID=A0A162VH80_DIDRA|nr:uncharacterized protein EKO05_0001303 [Ascochyta rabiei]KZM18454.1 hypothetical protein ST47_g10385 [Ascochyta rabiei]UPX10659.1 hypothetical protein EKO05_0001303 [Ascochyta rabiei]
MSQDPNLLSPRSASGFQSTPSPSTPVSPSDEPQSYDGGDIAMENIYASPLTSPNAFTRGDKSGSYISLNGPLGKHDSDNQSLLNHHSRHHHVKHFDHSEARKYLFKTGGYKLLVTIFFSALMCIALKAWEGFNGHIVLSKKDVRVFNSLMIGLSLCLGLNLLASLQNYAGILRWSLLSRRYVSLEAFDLMLGLERLSNVVKLMVISLPLVRRRKYLRKFSWFKDVRQDDTKWTWLVCLIWLAINVGSQVLVAVSSLFYPMDTSDFPLLTYGDVTVADLTRWTAGNETKSNATALEAAWMYGMEAIVYPEFAPNDTQKDLSGLAGTPLYKLDNGSDEYRFFNRNPNHPYSDYILSNRSISTTTTCVTVEVGGKIVENSTDDTAFVKGKAPGKEWDKFYLPQYAGGALTWMASIPEACGARCTNFTVLQNRLGNIVNETSLFLCNSTVSEIRSGKEKNDITLQSKEDSDAVFGTDQFARTASGAMGWTGTSWDNWDDMQFRTYTRGSRWSPSHIVNASEVEDMLMRFTIGAIAAFDDHGIRHNVTDQYVVPTQGQQLAVDWPYIFSILGGICFIQFAALCCLLLFANRTIVRDESFFSTAMLLSPVVGRIGKEGGGMNMSGDEIKDHPKLKWKKIRYDYREGKNGDPHQVDIFFEGKDSKESRKSWAAGAYS